MGADAEGKLNQIKAEGERAAAQKRQSIRLPSAKEKEIADLRVKRLYHPANHRLANGSQLSQQHLKTHEPNRQGRGLAVLVLPWGCGPQSI